MNNNEPLAEFFQPSRSWLSRGNSTHMSNYMSMRGRISIASLLAHMATIAPHVRQEEMLLNFGTLKWVDDATEAEQVEKAKWEAQNEIRTEKWERETLARLKAKYEAS